MKNKRAFLARAFERSGMLRLMERMVTATRPALIVLTYHRIAELYFADEAAMQAGFASPEGGATAADFQEIAPPGSRMFVAAVDD